jgi:hypothetical protein
MKRPKSIEEALDKKRLLIILLDRIKIDTKTGCWNWVAYSTEGYGRLTTYGGKQVKANRLSAHVFFDFDIDSELQINHKCDNSLCVNPKHLYAGTQSQNIQEAYDRDRKNRNQGIDNGQNKLSEDQVLQIRKDAKYDTNRNVADKYGISCGLVSMIVNKKRWSHL